MKNSIKKVSCQEIIKHYFIITYGCQMNVSDSEKIAGLLEKQGYQKVKDAKLADLVVINVCSVRQSAIDRVYSKIKELRIKNYESRIILAGCLLEADKKKLKDKVDEIWHPDKYFEGVSCYENKTMAYVPIMTGCNNFCAYCVVPYTRGQEKSRSTEKIIKEIKSLVSGGCKEIVLIGQNVNSYQSKFSIFNFQFSNKSQISNSKYQTVNFSNLLKIINNIPGNFQISFLTNHPKDMSGELIKAVAKCGKVKKEIHLPIQSGDDEILQKMNRGYSIQHYKKLIKKIRQKIPNVQISTDVIVGFPGETKAQFQNTVKIFRQIKFNKAYIAKYSPRAGTTAAKFKDDVSHNEKKRRWQILEEIANKK